MPVQRPGGVECGQAGVEPSPDDDEIQSRLAGQLQDQRVRIHGEEAGAEVPHGLDEGHRVLSSADRHEQARPERVRRRQWVAGLAPTGDDGHRAGHRQPIGDGELAQALVVEAVVEAPVSGALSDSPSTTICAGAAVL